VLRRCNLDVVFRAAYALMLACSRLAQTDKPEALAQANLGVSQAHKSHYREAIEAYQRALPSITERFS
jgi:hypothetical protein